MKRFFLYLLLNHFLFFTIKGQLEQLVQNDYYQLEIEKQQAEFNTNFHSAMRPYNHSEVRELFANSEIPDFLLLPDSVESNSIGSIEIRPVVFANGAFFRSSNETEFATDIFTGLNVTTNIQKKLAINLFAFYGTQIAQGWERILRDSLAVFPNWGVAKFGGLERYFDGLEGYISYSPDHIFNLEVGRGRHFFGDGINTLFLSSNANAYPYFKLSTKVWNIKYINLFAWQRDIRFNPFDRSEWRNKFSATHFLSWNVSQDVSLSLFETIIWAARDSLNNRGFDPNYLNPVIFYRPIEFSLGSADNAMIGVGIKWRPSNAWSFYGQWHLDEFLLSNFLNGDGWWANKFGAQIGFNHFDAFGIPNLNIKSEFNLVRPFTYSHGNVTQNYGHFNQSLAHPLGSNFYNLNVLFNYKKESWLIEGQLIYSHFGRDSVGVNLGGDIYQSYVDPAFLFGNEIAQGVKYNMIDAQLRLNYILQAKQDIRFFADLSYYRINQLEEKDNVYFRLGFRANWPDYR